MLVARAELGRTIIHLMLTLGGELRRNPKTIAFAHGLLWRTDFVQFGLLQSIGLQQ